MSGALLAGFRFVTALSPIRSDTQDDLFRCEACDLPVRIEMGMGRG